MSDLSPEDSRLDHAYTAVAVPAAPPAVATLESTSPNVRTADAANVQRCLPTLGKRREGQAFQAFVKNTFLEVQAEDSDEEAFGRIEGRRLRQTQSSPEDIAQQIKAQVVSCPSDTEPEKPEKPIGRPRSQSKFHPWEVDARKLQGNYRQLVSPPFHITLGSQSVTFRLIITPKVPTDSKGGASFQKSKGWGTVQVKCEAALSDDIAEVTYRIWVGSGQTLQHPQGPVCHNFAQNAFSELPKGQDQWNFNAAVDEKSSTFRVSFEEILATDDCSNGRVQADVQPQPIAAETLNSRHENGQRISLSTLIAGGKAGGKDQLSLKSAPEKRLFRPATRTPLAEQLMAVIAADAAGDSSSNDSSSESD
jgi:hypothetical protein